MSTALRLSAALEAIVKAIGRMAAWLSLPLALVIALDTAIQRLGPFAGAPSSIALQDLQWRLHAALFLLTLAWAYLADAHLRIDVARARMSPKVKAWVELLGCLCFLSPCAIALSFLAGDFFWKSTLSSDSPAASAIFSNDWLVKSTLPLAFVLLGCAALAVIANRLAFLFGEPWESEAAAARQDANERDS